MIAESLDAVLNLRRGLPYTLKQMVINPGAGVRDYIVGKRAGWYRPLAFIALMGVLSGLGLQVYGEDIAQVSGEELGPNGAKLIQEKLNGLFARNYSIFQAILLPLTSLWSYLFYVKSRFNYAENLVLNCYVIGSVSCATTVGMVLVHFLPVGTTRSVLGAVVVLSMFVYQVVCYVRFFQSANTASSVVRAILANIVSTLFIGLLLSAAMLAYMLNGGMDDLKEHFPEKTIEQAQEPAVDSTLPSDSLHISEPETTPAPDQ